MLTEVLCCGQCTKAARGHGSGKVGHWLAWDPAILCQLSEAHQAMFLLSSQTREYTEDWCKPNMPWISCTSHLSYGGRESSMRCKWKKKHMQIKKTSSSIWQHMCCKYSQRDKIQKRAANTTKPNTETRCKNRNALQILTTQPNTKTRCKYSQHNKIQKHTANTHNATKYRNALQILTTLQNTETRCKYSQHNQIQKHTANTHNATKYRNALQILTTRTNRKTLQIPTTQPNTEIHLKNRNALQILTTQPNTETCCKYAQHEQIQKHAAHTKNTTKYRNALQKLTTQQNTETRCKYSQHNQIQKCT